MADNKDRRPIFSLTMRCDGLFTKCVRVIESSDIFKVHESSRSIVRVTKDFQARFNAWSSYMGVFADEKLFLDRRLSEKFEIQRSIIKLLEVLKRNLQSLSEIFELHSTSCTPSNQPSASRSTSQTSDFLSRSQKHQRFIEGSIDRLHRLGITIRRSSTASLLSRVKAFSARRANPPLEELYTKTVKCLYPLAPESLQNHMVQSMLERYFRLLYRQERQKKLARPAHVSLEELNEDSSSTEEKSNATVPAITGPDRVMAGISDSGDVRESAITQENSSGTKPSTLKTDEFHQRLNANEAVAAASNSSPVSSAPPGIMHYPKPPRAEDVTQVVTCTWCFEPLPLESKKDHGQQSRWWRRHVDHDLKPYICLAESCSQPSLTFDKLSLWRAHMDDTHSPGWARAIHPEPQFACDIDHPLPLNLHSNAALESHVHETHGNSFTATQIASILRRSFRFTSRPEGICPFRCTYNAADDPTVKSQRADLITVQGGLLCEKLDNSLKRRKTQKQGPSKRARVVRFEINNQDDSSDSELVNSEDSEDSYKSKHYDSGRRWGEIAQKALSRHIAMHLTSLAFLTLRLKELQEREEEQDSSDSSSISDSDDNSYMSRDQAPGSELDAISLTFEEFPDRLRLPEPEEEQDDDMFVNWWASEDGSSANIDRSHYSNWEAWLPPLEEDLSRQKGRLQFGTFIYRENGLYLDGNEISVKVNHDDGNADALATMGSEVHDHENNYIAGAEYKPPPLRGDVDFTAIGTQYVHENWNDKEWQDF